MYQNDFETMPRGTIEELRVVRKFVNDLIALSNIHDMPVPHEIRTKIDEVVRFYATHRENYSV